MKTSVTQQRRRATRSSLASAAPRSAVAMDRLAKATSTDLSARPAANQSSSQASNLGSIRSATSEYATASSSASSIACEKSAATTRCPDRVSGTASDPAPHPMSSTLSPGRTSASFRKSRAYGCVSRGRKCRARAFQKSGESGDLRTRCNFFHSPFQSVSSNVARTGPSPVQPQSPTRLTFPSKPPRRHGRAPRRPHPRAAASEVNVLAGGPGYIVTRAVLQRSEAV